MVLLNNNALCIMVIIIIPMFYDCIEIPLEITLFLEGWNSCGLSLKLKTHLQTDVSK